MAKKPNYCRGVIIAHGKSEKLLGEHIKSNLHLPIEIYAERNGKKSIQVDSIRNILGNFIFANKRNFIRQYIPEIINGNLINFCVMPIMDLDDTSEQQKEKYKSGEMFKNHWLSPYIIPIWNDGNLDEVLLELGLIGKLPNDKEKGRIYREMFPRNTGESDKQQVEALMRKFESSRKTNMEVCIKKCLDSMQS